MSFHQEPDSYRRNKIKADHLYLSTYAIKSNADKATSVNTSEFAKKVDLAILKSNVDKLVADKLKTVQAYLIKLSNVAEKDIDKKSVYDELVKKVAAIVFDKQNVE